jgi:hypothetical protein
MIVHDRNPSRYLAHTCAFKTREALAELHIKEELKEEEAEGFLTGKGKHPEGCSLIVLL